MTEAMPFLQKYDITFLRPPTIVRGILVIIGTPNTDILSLPRSDWHSDHPGRGTRCQS